MSDYQSTTLTYNAENRLVEVKQGDTTIAAFTYDGDGCGLCTPEPRSGERGQRIVVRTGSSTLNWLVGDHLGSTTVTANSAGVWSATQLYKPWGEPRYPGGMQPGFGFTGQRGEPALGLYDYKARFYDPVLGRWIQSDSYVPDKGNPQGLDRYAYVANNPLKYEDSSGHCWGIASGIRGLPTYGTTCN
ncbi:MAG: hypothetical protein KGZ53_00665, partial [Peptococcaceae bacterium]|nr:hypothetical protein [Peptococcaceae bacterium]